MAHILTGEWRSFVVSSETGIPGGDERFILNINEGSGVIDPGSSSHGGNPVNGTASPGNSAFHNIKINKPVGNKKYRGYLLVNGPQLMLVGFIDRTPPDNAGLKEDATAEEREAFFNQQQEVWIATKP